MVGIHLLAALLFILQRFQLRLQFVEQSHVVVLRFEFLLFNSEEGSFVFVVCKGCDGQCLVRPARRDDVADKWYVARGASGGEVSEADH